MGIRLPSRGEPSTQYRCQRRGSAASFALLLPAIAALIAAAVLASCAGSAPATTTQVTAPTSSTPPTASTSTASSVSVVATVGQPPVPVTASDTTPVTTAPPPGGDLLEFRWDWRTNQQWSVDDISTITGAGKVVGDPYSCLDFPGTDRSDHLFATSSGGDLLMFSASPGSHDWQAENISTATGSKIKPLSGGPGFADCVATTTSGSVSTLHVFAADPDDNLIHFSWTPKGSWRSENLSSSGHLKVAVPGSVWASERSTLHALGTDPAGHLVHFWLPSGGSWHSEDVSELIATSSSSSHSPNMGRIEGAACLISDTAAAGSMTAAAIDADSDLLLFHLLADGTWTVEDVTAATGVTCGGWFSWWTWSDEPAHLNPLAVLDKRGHFQLLERARSSAEWTVTDVSALLGQTFKTETRGDSILEMDTPPQVVPAKEAHFAGVNQDSDLVHFWRDGKGAWHAEDLSIKAGRKIQHPVNHYFTNDQQNGKVVNARDFLSAIDQQGHLVVFWDDTIKRNWQSFDATQKTGYTAMPPEVPWFDKNGGGYMVMVGSR